jgi:hypothetical protein
VGFVSLSVGVLKIKPVLVREYLVWHKIGRNEEFSSENPSHFADKETGSRDIDYMVTQMNWNCYSRSLAVLTHHPTLPSTTGTSETPGTCGPLSHHTVPLRVTWILPGCFLTFLCSRNVSKDINGLVQWIK